MVRTAAVVGVVLVVLGIALHVIPPGQHLFIVSAKRAFAGKVLILVGGSVVLTGVFSRPRS